MKFLARRLPPAPYRANHDGSHQPKLHLRANIYNIRRIRLISPQTLIVRSAVKFQVFKSISFPLYNHKDLISSFRGVCALTKPSKMVQPLLPPTFLICAGFFSICFIAIIIKEFFFDGKSKDNERLIK